MPHDSSPSLLWFAIHRASGVPEMSCDQSHGMATMPLEQNSSTDPGKQSLFSTRTLQGQSTSKKEQFVLLIPIRYLGNYSYLVKATGRATIVTVEYLYSC